MSCFQLHLKQAIIELVSEVASSEEEQCHQPTFYGEHDVLLDLLYVHVP